MIARLLRPYATWSVRREADRHLRTIARTLKRALDAERLRDTAWDTCNLLRAQRDKALAERDSARQTALSTKDANLSRINTLERQVEQLQEQLDSNAVTADLDRVTRELARERRLRDQHAAQCPTAAAIQDHVDDKVRENSE